MNAKFNLKRVVLAAIVLTVGSAFAANKGSLDLRHTTSVAGKQLSSGSYTVRWEGSGDQVQLKIYQGKDEVLSTPAHLVKVSNPSQNDSTVVDANPDGTVTLSQIRFAGKSFALEIASGGGGAGAAATGAR